MVNADRRFLADAPRLLLVGACSAAVLGLALIADLLTSRGSAAGLLGLIAVATAVFSRRVWFVACVGSVGLANSLIVYVVQRPVVVLESFGVVELNLIVICVAYTVATAAGIAVVVRGRVSRTVSEQLATTVAEVARQSRLLQIAADVGNVGGWWVDLKSETVMWSDEVAFIHGRPAGYSLEIAEAVEYYIPEDRQRVADAVEACVGGGAAFNIEGQLTRVDGSQARVVLMGEAIRDEGGVVVALQGALQDVTAARLAQLAAVEQEKRLLMVSESVPAILWTASPDGTIDSISPLLASYTGRDAEELLNGQWVTVIHPDDRIAVDLPWHRSAVRPERFEVDFRLLSSSGEYRWHTGRTQAERDADGNVIRWWGSALDVHDARLSAARAAALAQEHEDILQSVSDAVYTVDREWRISFVNADAELALNSTRDELLGTSIWEAVPGLVGTVFEEAFRRAAATGEPERFSGEYEPHAGWYEVSCYPSADGLTVFFHDVTATRALTEQLARAQRLESVGQLTGGIAHDFNNLLTVVIGGVDALAEDPGLSTESREIVQLLNLSAARGAELTHSLLAFARNQPLAPRAIDINQLVLHVAPLLRHTLGGTITIDTDLALGLHLAEIDGAQLENAIVNLCINARDAMPEGGRLDIRTNLTTLDETYATQHHEVSPGAYVVISVSDTGTGMDGETLRHVFEPFFTTKESGKGSGMGMSMVYGFVKQSNGHVTVYSEPGLGTTVRLYLPLAAEGVEAALIDENDSSPVPTGTEHVLLVEDDELVQQFAVTQLRSLGYVVTTARSGPAALRVLETMDRLDLLFTDVIMPGGMSGRQLAEAVVERRPGTAVLYTSGYTENVIVHNGKLDSGVVLLSKPYSRKQLAERLRLALADTRTPSWP